MKTGQRQKRSVKWKRNPYKSRIIQNATGLEYALVSDKMEQATDFTRNPMHLLEAMWGSIQKEKIESDGFKYNPKIHPEIRKNKVAILIANPKDKEFSLRIPGVVNFINQIEYDFSMPPTVARGCYDPPTGYNEVWYIEGSQRWVNAPPMLSFYMLCIAMGLVHEPGALFRETIEAIKGRKLHPYNIEDLTTWEHSEQIIERILDRGDRHVFYREITANYPRRLPIGALQEGKTDLSLDGVMYYVSRYKKGQRNLIPYWPIIPLSG
jgi:hypothetical protein